MLDKLSLDPLGIYAVVTVLRLPQLVIRQAIVVARHLLSLEVPVERDDAAI